jgi:acyl-homoserine-lactone acylase
MQRRRVSALVTFGLLVAACSGGDSEGGPTTVPTTSGPTATSPSTDDSVTDTVIEEAAFTYRATIRRTAHNIPHILAGDTASMGYGYGYAFAEDHLCSLADVVVQARSEASSFFGTGDDDRWLNQDLVLRAMALYERASKDFDNADPEMQEIIRGYAAGYNRYLADTGADEVPGYCQGAPWVRPIDSYDLAAYYKMLAGRASIAPLLSFIATAQPPAAGDGATADTSTEATAAAFESIGPAEATMASNAWAVGPERTADGTTMLVGNPHFPWQGALRFYEVHLTVPGRVNVYGASLLGSPAVNIGFTEGVAWSHTVSAGRRFTVYSLDLDPDDPTRYRYGDESRAMTPSTVTVDVRQPDGSTSEVVRTLWSTHYGPVLNFPGVGWSDSAVLTIRDANADNDELLPQFWAMNQATSMDELIAAHRDHAGIPWVNTIAASAEGRIWYADTASSPSLSAETITAWKAEVALGGLAKAALDNGVLLLDGSDPANEWTDIPGARDPGVVPFAEMPQVERADFVFNANDPYWFNNPDALMSEFSPAHGDFGRPLTPRTRGNARQLSVADGDAGDDGRFTFEELRDSAVGNRVFTAEVLLDEVVARCRLPVDQGGVAEQQICDVLAGWDRRVDIDSVGAGLWREFIDQFSNAEIADAGPLWKNPFDPADPLRTPNGLADGPQIAERLTAAAAALREMGFDIDTPLGEMQYAWRGAERIPLHGGRGDEGVSNVIVGGRDDTTTSEDEGVPEDPGYSVVYGTSFIYAIEYTRAGPVAEAFLTYGQSGDPASPFFADQTRLFSDKQWRTILFSEEAIASDSELREYEIAE